MERWRNFSIELNPIREIDLKDIFLFNEFFSWILLENDDTNLPNTQKTSQMKHFADWLFSDHLFIK